MRICVYGAGSIGGWVGGLLARSGVDVTLIARGPHLAAMQASGLKVIQGEEEFVTRPRVTSDAREAGEQDYVFVTLKAHSVPPIVEQMQPLLGSKTAVITGSNGIPWWYFHGLVGEWEGHRLDSVDPGGKQWDVLGPERAIGSVIWPAAELVEPGVVKHEYGDRISLGEPDGSKSDRVVALSQAFGAAGLKSPVRPRIRDEIWMKLWGNLCLNPVSALTGATLETMVADPGVSDILRRMMAEGQAVGERLGARFAMGLEARLQSAGEVGAHKTSMLQDLERGRPMEIDALVKVVSELGQLVSVPTPTIETVYHLVAMRAREAGCYM
jgi:2-dehydropantoate 2-reductase